MENEENEKPIRIDFADGDLTAYLEGELDHHAAAPIREAIDNAIKADRPTRIILDFGGLTFMDSSGIGLVMGRSKTALDVGAQLVVRNVSRQTYKVMRLSGIDRIAAIETHSDSGNLHR